MPGDVIFRFALMFYDTRADFGNQSRDVAGSGLVANTADFREQSSDGTEGMVSSNAGCDANRLLKHRNRIIVRPLPTKGLFGTCGPFGFHEEAQDRVGKSIVPLPVRIRTRMQRCQFPRPSFSRTCKCGSGNLFESRWPLDPI